MASNAVDIIVNKADLRGIAEDLLEDKLVIYLQRITKCDVNVVSRTNDADNAHFTLQFIDVRGEESEGHVPPYTPAYTGQGIEKELEFMVCDPIWESNFLGPRGLISYNTQAVARALVCSHREFHINQRKIPLHVSQSSWSIGAMDSFGEDFAGRSIIDGEGLSSTAQVTTPDFFGSSLLPGSLGTFPSVGLQTASVENRPTYSDLDDIRLSSLSTKCSEIPHQHVQPIVDDDSSSSSSSSYHDATDMFNIPDMGACSPAKDCEPDIKPIDDFIMSCSLSPPSTHDHQEEMSPSPERFEYRAELSSTRKSHYNIQPSPEVQGRPFSSVFENKPKETTHQGATIEVTGYQNSNTVKRYFSHQVKSGGGELEKDGFIEDTRKRRINITFKDPKVVEAVVSRKHELEGQQLTVLRTTRRTPIAPRKLDMRCLLLSGLPDTDDESLFLFLEAKTKMEEPPTIEYVKNQPGTALVRYQTKIKDFNHVVKNFRKKSFKVWAEVGAKPVYEPECILVKGVPAGTHEDTIEYFFEDILEKQCGPGEEHVRDVQMVSQDQALVFFNDQTDVYRVLGKNLPLLDETATLTVKAFYECMGTTSAATSRSEIPTPISVKVSASLTYYIMNTKCPKDTLEADMRAAHAQVAWPHEGNSRKMLIKPLSDSQFHEHDKSKWEDWEQKVRKSLEIFYSQYHAEAYGSVAEESWDPIQHQLESIRQSCDVSITILKERTLLLRGMKGNVSQALESLNNFVQELKEEVDVGPGTEDLQNVTECLDLQPHKMAQLEMCQITKKIRLNHPDVTVVILKEENRVEFRGNKTDILQARVVMLEVLQNLFQSTPEINPHQRKFIIQVKNEIHEVFSKRSIYATCVENKAVRVSGETDTDVKRACRFLQEEIKYDQLPLTSANELAVLEDDAGSDFLRLLNAENVLALSSFNPKDKCLEIAGFRDAFNHTRDACTRYVKDNAITDCCMSLPEDQVKYLQKHFGAAEIQPSVSVKWNHELDPGLSFRGRAEDVRKAKRKIRAQKIVEKSHPVKKMGVRALLSDQTFLAPIEEKHKCYIKIIDMERPKQQDESPGLAENSQRSTSIVKGQYRIHTGQELLVVFGDLTNENVDAIVNAANTRMQHEGGVAEAIVKAGGQIIQDESNEIMRKRTHELNSSELVCTGSGQLPCKHVLHVAGPIWEDGYHQEEDILWDCVTNILDKANEMGLKSIAMPAISSGIYKFPLTQCAQTIIQATCEYFATQQKATSVSTIRFTHIDEETCKHFMDFLSASVYTEQPAKDERGHAAQIVEGAESISIPSGSGLTVIQNSPDTLSTTEGKTIQLKRGNIAKETVDVIVNSVGLEAVLRGGAVSTAILTEAGPKLQRECDSKRRRKTLSHWDHIKTGPANLQCQAVYHLNCQNYNFSDKAGQQVIERNFVHSLQQIMKDADRTGMISIAIPAIGTGKLGFPPTVVAQLMFEAALTFSSQNPSGPLNDIRFVLYQKDQNIIKAFEDEIQNIGRQKSTHTYVGEQTPKSHVKPKAKSADTEKIYEDFQVGRGGVCRIKIGSIIVELTEGDILTANTDVVVNSTNPGFDLGGPLSTAILKLGGKAIQDECENLGPYYLQKEQVVLTGAGKFQHTMKIAHIMMLRGYDTTADLKEKIQKALEVTEKHRMTSIALPAVGTGDPNLQPQETAKALFKAIGTFAVSNPQHLLLVKVIIFQPAFFHDYKHVMQSQEGRSYNVNIGKRIVNAMRQVPGKVRKMRKGSSEVDEAEEAKEQPDTVVFHILAGSDDDITAAEATIEEFISSEFVKKVVLYDKNCGRLTAERQKRLKSVASQNQTSIEFLIGESMKSSRFAILGKKDHVDTTYTEVLKLLNRIQVEERQRVENESLNKEVQWRYQDEFGQFLPYEEEINPLVESAYRKKAPFIDLDLDDGKIRIDFSKEEEISLTGKKPRMRVYRADLVQEAVDRLPSHWDPHKHRDSIDISTSSHEFQKVSDSYYNSFTGTKKRRAIIKIERIQNVELWKQYMAKKDTMRRMLPSHVIEHDLFHGTSGNAVQHINSQGFNRSFHGKNATVFGRGTYFAKNATYSVDYADPDTNGSRYMYRCKVLTGEYIKGEESMIVPPMKPHSASREPFESVVDNPLKPTIFVVFRDAQAYPEYLITFK